MQCRVTVDQVPIDVLPGDVLQEIFAFYVGEAQPEEIEKPHGNPSRWVSMMVKHCLRITTSPESEGHVSTSVVDNVVALLGHHNRMCQIQLTSK